MVVQTWNPSTQGLNLEDQEFETSLELINPHQMKNVLEQASPGCLEATQSLTQDLESTGSQPRCVSLSRMKRNGRSLITVHCADKDIEPKMRTVPKMEGPGRTPWGNDIYPHYQCC